MIPGQAQQFFEAAAAQSGTSAYEIERSVRFESDDTAYLTRTPSTAGNRRIWTWSGWVKRCATGVYHNLFSAAESGTSNPRTGLTFDNNDALKIEFNPTGSAWISLVSDAVFRDPSAWYHVVIAMDTTQATSSDRTKVYVNGVQQTFTGSYVNQNVEVSINNNWPHSIGRFQATPSSYLNGYLADIHFIDGQALAPTDFGETNDDGLWVPKEYAPTFSEPNEAYKVWSDDLTASSGFQSDYPAINAFDGVFTSDSSVGRAAANNSGSTLTFAPTGGITVTDKIEVYTRDGTITVNGGSNYTSSSSLAWKDISSVSPSTPFTLTSLTVTGTPGNNAGEIYGIRIDGVVLRDLPQWGHNGFHLKFSDTSTNQALGFDSSVTVSDPDPALGMDVVTYTGNGTTQNISGYNFEPGLVWVKQFNTSRDHCWCDIVRGPEKRLRSNTSDAQTDESVVTGFDPSGFTVGSDNGVNQNAGTYVAWAWKAGGLPVTNTDGSTSAQVSANDTHGFSICQYEGTGTLATIGHGLSTAPKFMIVRNIDAVANWNVYHTSLGATKRTRLDQDSASQTSSGFWNDTDPTSSVFTVNTDNDVNASNQTIIAYVWSEITGYSKFGSYTGNGTSVGPVVEVGFEARWIMIKRAEDVGNWIVYDTVRDGRIDNTKRLYANTGSAEVDSSGYRLDITSTTFQPLSSNDNFNASSEYIYVAFANRPGNNWTVNNILTDAGLTTSRQNFDVMLYTGNANGSQAIGQPVYSNQTTGGSSTSNMFDGSSSSWNNLTAGNTITFSPNPAIACTQLEIWVDTDTPIRVNVNGGGYGSTFTQSGLDYVDITPGGGITSLTSLLIDAPSSGGGSGAGIRGLRINGTTIVVDGNGGSGLQFQPDFVWIKGRNAAAGHVLMDSVRGTGNKVLTTNSTGAEGSETYGQIKSFDSNGFTVEAGSTSDENSNYNSRTYVAWCWKAGGTPVSNTDGSITSSVSANAAYGFSVVTYTGNGTAPSTVGHGLGAAPSLIIFKRRDTTSNWITYNSNIGADEYLVLNNTGGTTTDSGPFNNTAATSTVFTVNTFGDLNASGGTYVAYCFANIPGYQRVGSFVDTSNSQTLVLGFRPRFFMVKRTDSTGDWFMFDALRDNFDDPLRANTSAAEGSVYALTPTDTGISWTGTSFSDGDYIYIAIADSISAEQDSMIDSPTNYEASSGNNGGNYATLNSASNYGLTLSNGNLDWNGGTTQRYARPTIFVDSGKWYCEFTMQSTSHVPGIIGSEHPDGAGTLGELASSRFQNNGTIGYSGADPVTGGLTWAVGDIVQLYMDMDNKAIYWGVNGTLKVGNDGNTGDPTSGASKTGAVLYTGMPGFTDRIGSGYWGPCAGTYGTDTSVNSSVNFGQRAFAYSAPSGYKTLCTTNLPTPTIADGSDYFKTVLWTGDGTNNRKITTPFGPDFVWAKFRNQAYSHGLYDTVRGDDKRLVSNSSDAEGTVSLGMESDGFVVEGSSSYNDNSDTFVAWTWDAGSSTVSNTDGSITSNVRANASAGFSIVSYTGSGANATIGHGLNATPKLIIAKTRSSAVNWIVYHGSLDTYDFLRLNTTAAVDNNSVVWNTAPTSSVFGVGTANGVNQSSDNYIAYCFAPIEGYSAFGSYTGNGSSDGPFVNIGFRPAFIILKDTDNTFSWIVYDTARNTYNQSDTILRADFGDAEIDNQPTNYGIDVVSNGFKVKAGASSQINTSSAKVIYMAFAEHPFQTNGGLAR